MRKCVFPILIILFLAAIAALALQSGDKAPAFNLKDQFGKQWELDSLKGRVVVIVGANRDSGTAMGPWVDNLKKKYDNKIQILGLLDLHTIPAIGRGIARSRIRSETNDSMMIDFNGDTSRLFGINSASPVIVVIDKDGIIRSVQNTKYSDYAFTQITNAIDKGLQ